MVELSSIKRQATAILTPERQTTLVRSSFVFLSRLGGAIAAFVMAIILARTLSLEDMGFVMRLMSLVILFSVFCTLNMENGSVRHLLQPLERGNVAEAAGFIYFGRRVFIKAAPLVMLAFLVFTTLPEIYADRMNDTRIWAFILAALAVPIIGWTRLVGAWGHSLSCVTVGTFFNGFLRSFLMLVFVLILLRAGWSIHVSGVMAANLGAAIFALVGQQMVLHRSFAFTKDVTPDTTKRKDWVRTGLFLAATIGFLEYFQNIVLAAAAFGMSEADIALLAIALRFVSFLRMGLMAVNTAIDPTISQNVTNDDRGAAQKLLAFSTNLKFWPTLAITALVWWIAPFLVGIFGTEYLPAAWALRLAALLPLFSAIYGPSILILNITGHQGSIFNLSLLATFLLVLSVPIAGSIAGVTGATAAAVATVFIWESALYQVVIRETGLDASIFNVIFRRHGSIA